MHAITKYVANDRSEWNTVEDAEKRDELIIDVKVATSILKEAPDDMEFANGHGYVQQRPEIIQNVKESLYALANRDGVLKWWIDGQKKDRGKTDSDLINNCHPSYFCRMLDGGHGPLSEAYNRLCRIDEQNREWGQPYYAINPGTAAYHGGKGALIQHLLEQYCEIEKGLSAEDIADLEEMERQEKEALIADYTPNLGVSPFYRMSDDLATWLLGAAMESDEKFDEVFESIMINRYGKKVLRVDGEKQEVLYRAESVDDLDCVITGYKE